MRAIMATCAGAVLLAACTTEVETGRASYADLCAGCHGAGGQGDGPLAAGLEDTPADLTRLAAANGGVFPRVAAMSRIDGYARGRPPVGGMPAFGPLLEGRTVLVETGDGILTPTPEPLVALAAYLESIQK